MGLLRDHVHLHAHTIYYWDCVGDGSNDEVWRVTPDLREIVGDLPRAFAPAGPRST